MLGPNAKVTEVHACFCVISHVIKTDQSTVSDNRRRILNKNTVRGGRVAEISAHFIQSCDWSIWQRANHSTEY